MPTWPACGAARPSISWASGGLRVPVLVMAQVAAAAPALVALAELVAVAAPGHVAEVAAVVADHVDVGPRAAGQLGDRRRWASTRCRGSPGSGCRGAASGSVRAAVLRVHVAPGRPVDHQVSRRAFSMSKTISPNGAAVGLAVAQKAGDRQAPAVGGNGRERIDVAGAELACPAAARRPPRSSRRSVPSSFTRLSVSRPPPTCGLVDEVVHVLARRARPRRPVAPDFARSAG